MRQIPPQFRHCLEEKAGTPNERTRPDPYSRFYQNWRAKCTCEFHAGPTWNGSVAFSRLDSVRLEQGIFAFGGEIPNQMGPFDRERGFRSDF